MAGFAPIVEQEWMVKTMSDLISREAVIERIKRMADGYSYLEVPTDYLIQELKKIEEAPTIDAVKHGRWIKMSDADGQYYCCSECGEELYRKWTFDREFDLFPKKESIEKTMYCYNCGARMDERKES